MTTVRLFPLAPSQRRRAIGRAPLPMIPLVRPEVRAVSLALRHCAGALGRGKCASLAVTFHSVFSTAAGSVARWPRNARQCLGCIIDSRLVVATAIAARCRTNEFEAIVSFAPRISFDLRVTSVYSANFRTVKIGGNETSAVAVKDEVTHKCATSANDRGFSHVLFCDTQREAPSPLSRDREIIPLTCSRRRGEKFRAGDGACLSLSISLSLSCHSRARMSPAATWLRAACRPVRGTRNGDDSPSDERRNVLCRVQRGRRPVILRLRPDKTLAKDFIDEISRLIVGTNRNEANTAIQGNYTYIFPRNRCLATSRRRNTCMCVCVCVCAYVRARDSSDPLVVNKPTSTSLCSVLSSPLPSHFVETSFFFLFPELYGVGDLRTSYSCIHELEHDLRKSILHASFLSRLR